MVEDAVRNRSLAHILVTVDIRKKIKIAGDLAGDGKLRDSPGIPEPGNLVIIAFQGRRIGIGIVEMWYDDVKAFQDSVKFIRTEAGKALRKGGKSSPR
jgi:hypothetical protein